MTPALTGRIPKNGTFVDVGSGAGFPGVPLTMLYPELGTILVDSLGKRVRFLQELTVALGVTAECVHSRAEELGQTSYREQCDVVTARAVANLSVLCEYCLPLAKVGGVFLAMKGGLVRAPARAGGGGGAAPRRGRPGTAGGEGGGSVSLYPAGRFPAEHHCH